ncbi:tRNA-dihydrouridine synthase [Halovenus rubra]|uniref:tRNA-dihydrouridine synthase n=2 Tax=Halovenus rubra TaxID=869890 RepID=A0ABD5XE90_9EURY|nr:tRNA-dihydrouridine synthase [Halovenus rubra]
MNNQNTAPESNQPFKPPVALASLSGQSDAEWAKSGSTYAGIAFLGGLAIDEATREAARTMAERERNEFLPADPVSFVDSQLDALGDVPIQAGFNIRTTRLEPLADVADVCRKYSALLEINAHCRQDEICSVGGGESLLADRERLCKQVSVANERGVDVSVKVRTEVSGVALPSLCESLETAGASVIHVDAMDSEHVVADIAARTSLTIIANNGVRNRETVFEYLNHGADAVSVGRPSDQPTVLSRVNHAVNDWYSAKHNREPIRVVRNTEEDPVRNQCERP